MLKSKTSKIIAAPLALLVDLWLFSQMAKLLRADSDLEFYSGVFIGVLIFVGNVLFIKQLIKK